MNNKANHKRIIRYAHAYSSPLKVHELDERTFLLLFFFSLQSSLPYPPPNPYAFFYPQSTFKSAQFERFMCSLPRKTPGLGAHASVDTGARPAQGRRQRAAHQAPAQSGPAPGLDVFSSVMGRVPPVRIVHIVRGARRRHWPYGGAPVVAAAATAAAAAAADWPAASCASRARRRTTLMNCNGGACRTWADDSRWLLYCSTPIFTTAIRKIPQLRHAPRNSARRACGIGRLLCRSFGPVFYAK